MPEAQDRFELNPDVVYTTLDDEEAVLLHLKTRRYYSLNETSMFIWERMEQRENLSDIAAALSEHYDVEADEALEHVKRFVEDLQQDDLVARV